jgi:hypothetical protein
VSPTDIETFVPRAVMDANGEAVLGALASLPPESQPRALVRRGFLYRGNTVSFVDLCVDQRAAGVLEHVLSQAPYGLTLSDFSHCGPVEGWSKVYRSLHRVATYAGYADGLKLALKLEPENADLSCLFRYMGQNATLHYLSVHKVCKKVVGTAAREHRLGAMECARLLMAHGAPIRSHGGEDPNPLTGAFFGNKWPEVMVDELPGLLKHYAQASLVDLDAPLHLDIPVVGGLPPLAAALKNGCPAACRELILLGCDLNVALPTDSADVLEMAHRSEHPDWLRGELAASITEALMLRQAATIPSPPRTTPARRDKRACL